MTNTIDLFQPEYERLTLPAAGVMVFLDNTLCEDLEPVEIVRSGWPEFGWARLNYNPAARGDASVIPLEQIEDRFAMGTSIRICQPYDATPPDVAIGYLPLFVGQIEGMETTVRGDNETVGIIAKDFSAIFRRITVYGQRLLQSDSSAAFLSGLETAFNPVARGNAAAEVATTDGQSRTIFSASTEGAGAWSCAEAILYLLREHVPSGALHAPSLEELLALTERGLVRDLDVTGLNLLDALHRCCEAAGLQFRFVPRLAEAGPAQALVLYRNGRGRVVELSCQPRGQSLSVSRTSIGAFHSRRDFYPVTHRFIGQGDFKVYEATFELVKAWDPALESTSYSEFSASTNPEFHKVKDIYRKWCLNEAGDYSGAPYHQSGPYDFSHIFEHADYVPRRRRFWPALSTDACGTPLGYFLQVSFDGVNWWTYPGAFNNLLEECGIWLSGDHLDVDTWVAALKGVLRFRMTASVVSDERLTCMVADGPTGSTAAVVDHVLTLPRQFRYRKISPQSVLAQTLGAGFGAPDEADDSAALYQFVRRHAAAAPAVIETVVVQTPSLTLHWEPGDRVTSSPQSRDLLGSQRDSRSRIWVERVHLDFPNQCTNLQLVRQRTYDA
jgi:hypothetical protein